MADFREILRGSFFIFEVGHEKERLHVHSGIIAKHSQVLGKLMNNGEMTESVDKIATLDDIEPETFIHFVQYAYKGTYGCSPRVFDADKYEVLADEIICRFELGETGCIRCCYCGRAFHSPNASHLLRCRATCRGSGSTYCILCGKQVVGPKREVPICLRCSKSNETGFRGNHLLRSKQRNESEGKLVGATGVTYQELLAYFVSFVAKDEDEESTELLSHAKLYVFADRYDVQPLRALCLHKLHRDLLMYKVGGDNLVDVVALMEYTYTNTIGRNDDQGEGGAGEDLRELVISFAVCHAEVLKQSKEFLALLRDGADVFADFTCALIGELSRKRTR